MGLNGKSFMSKRQQGFQPSGLNLEARAGGAGAYASRAAGGGANKDIAAAAALIKQHQLKPLTKTAASAAPGPKV